MSPGLLRIERTFRRASGISFPLMPLVVIADIFLYPFFSDSIPKEDIARVAIFLWF
jgi:hypothetical protein